MRTALAPSSVASALVALLVAVLATLPGCSSLKTDKDLTFAQVQAVSVGLTAAQVRDGFGEPQRVGKRADGTIERMEYPALDAKGGKYRLALEFDARERLVQKTFSGQVTRP